MEIQLKLLANYRKLLPPDTKGYQISIVIPDNAQVESVLDLYSVPPPPESVVLVNGITPATDCTLQEGDVICAFPAMAGGNI